jgi:TPP-dependent pyruvate/acetoin dehydrogenase alpha subunit
VEADLDAIEARVKDAVEQAVEFAKKSPPPPDAQALEFVYA